MLNDLIKNNRSYRRFYDDYPISQNTLRELIELARLSASAANLQPLKFIISYKFEKNEKIFPHTQWAGYIKDWPGPAEGERPSAYIIILGDTEIKDPFGCDHGIAAQSILLGATEKGLGGCMIGSIDKDGLRKALNITERYEILLVIALGKPKEKVVIDEAGEGGDIKYWRDEKGVHHVPKRTLEELILNL